MIAWITIFNSIIVFGLVYFILRRFDKQKNQFGELNRKLNVAYNDIKTLHHNQKVIQSTIREIHKDLRLYGEVKNIVPEKENQ